MSILTEKHVLVVGEETNQISKIEAALITYGATITSSTCEETDAEKIESEHIDLILLNHLHDGAHCRDMLDSLIKLNLLKAIPVFALVENDQEHIGDALMLGAADYIVPGEDVHNVIEKIKVVFGDSAPLGSSSSAIDLTPTNVSADGEGIRVFAVEDDSLLRNLLAIKFEKSHVPFEISGDGLDLNTKLKAFRPQIVILDLMLPGKDGFELLEEIRADADTADIPVIIFSNKDSAEDRKRASELGAKGFYVKALTDLSDLMKTIEQHAQR
jgi:DNA-binding response OmpR family regulator